MFGRTLVLVLLYFHSVLTITVNQIQPRFGDDDWTYDNQRDWDEHFKACNGSHESPINIDSTKVEIDSHLRIQFFNYDERRRKSTAQNNGHTVRVFLHLTDVNQIPYVTGEALKNEKFILDSFHFHWGQNQFNGSEHSIDKVKRSAELHLVHWNDKYGNMTNARDREDGLVVVTVFIETKIITNHGVVQLAAHNPALMPIIDVLPKITHFSNSTRIRVAINLKELLPRNRDIFFKYDGSLTTPPCSPTATFIIFSDPIYMTTNQLSRFRHIEGEPFNGISAPMTHNTREQFPLEDRIVKVSNPFVRTNTKVH